MALRPEPHKKPKWTYISLLPQAITSINIMTHAQFHFNQLMLTLIFGIWASEPGEQLKRLGLIGLSDLGILVKIA